MSETWKGNSTVKLKPRGFRLVCDVLASIKRISNFYWLYLALCLSISSWQKKMCLKLGSHKTNWCQFWLVRLFFTSYLSLHRCYLGAFFGPLGIYADLGHFLNLFHQWNKTLHSIESEIWKHYSGSFCRKVFKLPQDKNLLSFDNLKHQKNGVVFY